VVGRACVVVVVLVVRSSAVGALPPLATAGPLPVVSPGGGALLSDPLVIGSDIVGRGALVMVDGAITNQVSNFDDTPPELSLRAFTLVRDLDLGGYSAVLRYFVPIVQLHSWRGIAVRMTQTIILRPPSPDGTTTTASPGKAVQIQADGTTAVGTWDGQTFRPTGPGNGVIVGNVAVMNIPPSLGVSPDWTVQALVQVVADEPFHNGNPATGYAAGSSIVPAGYLSGEADPTETVTLVDARTTLPAPSATTPAVAHVPDALRVTAIRLEGTGEDRVLAVDTADNPVNASTVGAGFISISFSLGGFSALAPAEVASLLWLPGSTTDVQIRFPGGGTETVPTTVTPNGVRFALGKGVSAPPPADGTHPSSPPLDLVSGSVVVPLGPDENVNSTDGIAAVNSVAHTPSSLIVAVDRGKVRLTEADATVVTGFVDSRGRFVAYNDTENYAGVIDLHANVVVYRTVLAPSAPAASGIQSSPGPSVIAVNVTGDYTTAAIAATGPLPSTTTGLTIFKYEGPDPTLNFPPPDDADFPPPDDLPDPWDVEFPDPEFPTVDVPDDDTFGLPDPPPLPSGLKSTTGEPAQPDDGQAGSPDWPLLPQTAAGTATGREVRVQVTAGVNTDTGTTQFLSPWLDTAAITRTPVAPVTAPTTPTTPIAAVDTSSPAASISVAPTTTQTTPADAVTNTSVPGSGSSSTPVLLAIGAAVLASAGGGAWYATRRRRRVAGPD
jgi:hypothetical protein